MKDKLQIKYANTIEEARKTVEEGFEPVECSFGSESVVGKYVLDHHGKYSNEEPVSVKATKLASEKKVKLDKFVVAGIPDFDQMYAIAMLNGKLNARYDTAEAIGEIDIDPVGKNLLSERYFPQLLFNFKTENITQDLKGAEQAFETTVKIISGLNSMYGYYPVGIEDNIEFYSAVKWYEQKIENALSEIVDQPIPETVALSHTKGRPMFNEWYRQAPIVVAYVEGLQRVSIGMCPKKGGILTNQTGYDILGKDGLLSVIPSIDKYVIEGFGGRPEIIGSPRGEKMTFDQAEKTAQTISEYIMQYERSPK